jgi:HEAT repeat protein
MDGARGVVVRSRISSRILDIAAGHASSLEAAWAPDLVAGCLDDYCRPRRLEPAALHRLAAAVRRSPFRGALVKQLTAADVNRRRRALSVVGRLGIEEAIPWIAPLLASPDATIRTEAARALGRIGGLRSADAMVKALYWRRGSAGRTVIELARAAPPLYLERALIDPKHGPVRASLAVAAGLRRRRTAVAALIHVTLSGSRSERMAACRALGWIGDPTAVPAIQYLLLDSAWQARSAALKALAQIQEPACREDFIRGLDDRNARNRRTAAVGLRRLHNTAIAEAGHPARSEALAWA